MALVPWLAFQYFEVIEKSKRKPAFTVSFEEAFQLSMK